MNKKLGLLVGAITLTSALIPLTNGTAGAATSNGYWTCFAKKATITDATKTTWTAPEGTKYVGGPQTIDYGVNHKGVYNVFYGTAKNDVIVGTSGPDLIIGNGGHDRICAMDANDIVVGDAGPSGSTQIDGGNGDDQLFGHADAATASFLKIYGGPGNDIIDVGGGNNYLDGSGGLNAINGRYGIDQCFNGKTAQTVEYSGEDWDLLRKADAVTVAKNFNCESMYKGRTWSNHAKWVVVTTTTTTP